mmetsp:Transcript_13508/g.27466  ORF Transcript_13508/g.27466 Transcript_13508/m.27466 type:complete len:325 (+) Transcript_13508:157-1131(+)
MYPYFFSFSTLFLQSLSTLTFKSRNILTPKNSSSFLLALIPTSLIFLPPLPTTIPFCESRSTSIVAPILIKDFPFFPAYPSASSKYLFDSSNDSTLTSQQYGNSFPSDVNNVSRINSEVQNRSVRSVKKSGWYSGGPMGKTSLAISLVTMAGAPDADEEARDAENMPGTGLPRFRIAPPTSTLGSFASNNDLNASTPGSSDPFAAQVGKIANAFGNNFLHFCIVCTAFNGVLRTPSESSFVTRSTLLTHTMMGLLDCCSFRTSSSPIPRNSSSINALFPLLPNSPSFSSVSPKPLPLLTSVTTKKTSPSLIAPLTTSIIPSCIL